MMASQLHAMTIADPVRRVSITYQDPCRGGQQVVVTETPITPPLSPKSFHLEQHESMAVDGSLSSKALDFSPTPTLDEEPMAVEPVRVDVAGPGADAKAKMEADLVAPLSNPPARLLEDEKVRLQPSGIRLQDFEVRGTLGKLALRMNNRGLSHSFTFSLQAPAPLERFCWCDTKVRATSMAPRVTSP